MFGFRDYARDTAPRQTNHAADMWSERNARRLLGHRSYRTYLLAALGVLLAANGHAAPIAPLYIAPDGNDANPGTVAKPLASLKGARDKVRTILTAGKQTSDIEVRFKAGDYLMEEPVEFGPEDSGKDGHRVIYRNADAIGSARLLGGKKVTAKWTPDKEGVYKIGSAPTPSRTPCTKTASACGKPGTRTTSMTSVSPRRRHPTW